MSEEYTKFILQLIQVNDQESRLLLINNNFLKYNKSKEEIDNDFFEILEQECRKRIKDVAKCKSPFKQSLLRVDLTNWFNSFLGDPKEAAKLINIYSAEETQATFYNLRELLELRDSASEKYLVKGLIPLGGMFLLVAASKVGKSLLATDLAVSVMLQEPFLNRETIESNVLYIQNEENLAKTTAKRVFNRGLQQLELNNKELYETLLDSHKLTVCKELDIVLEQDLIANKIKELNINLVLIDSLGASIKKSGLTELSSELIASLYNLQKVSHDNDATILLLHHATKMDNKETQQGMMSGIAGHNGIIRANDGVIRLFPPDKNNKNTQLHTIPRDQGTIQLDLQIRKGEANYWKYEVTKETILSPENIQLQNAILRLLFVRWNDWKQENPELNEYSPRVYGLSLEEIVELLDCDKDEVIARLNDMLSTEAIIYYPNYVNKHYTYAIDESGESWLSCYLEKEEENKREKEAKELEEKLYKEQILQIANICRNLIIETDKIELHKTWDKLSVKERKDIEKILTKEELNNMALMYYPPDLSIGTLVKVVDENIIEEIIKVEYVKSGKKSYHMYSLNNQPTRTFKIEQIQLYEPVD